MHKSRQMAAHNGVAKTTRQFTSLKDLHFDNVSLSVLPVAENKTNEQREIRGAWFARVTPTPLDNPTLVAASLPALSLLDLGPHQVEEPDFVQYFAGNKLLPGSEPVAHCYCGCQFGLFSGQLGDGAAIILGEVLNAAGERWEIQIKGPGLTPFSRQADGRKVLRSSIRELLASEAMFHLGIPTTRAGALVTSDSLVVRDQFYTGNPRKERASTVLRIAPTFLRFGSFEIFKPADPVTGRQGPSFGMADEMLPRMVDHVIRQYYPDVWQAFAGGPAADDDAGRQREHREDMVAQWFRQVVQRTAALVAAWQCVGFCHGVLNTDNMHIMGLTLDYGPYGWMDRYDPGWACNHSDDSGRYDYLSQPDICLWNCRRLAEALKPQLPTAAAQRELGAFDEEFDRCYWGTMRRKLGLTSLQYAEDHALINDLLDVMHSTGADFTNTFRRLSSVPMPPANVDLNDEGSTSGRNAPFLEWLLPSLASAADLAAAAGPRMPRQDLRMLLALSQRDPNILHALGATPQMLQAELERAKQQDALAAISPETKREADAAAWRGWLGRYTARLQRESEAGVSQHERVAAMNSVNPRYVLRNWMAQAAIDAAERGDFSEVRRQAALLERPFSDNAATVALTAVPLPPPPDGACTSPFKYDGPVPGWAKSLCVSCSS